MRYCSDIPTICVIKTENLAQKHLIKTHKCPLRCPLHEAKKKLLAKLYTSLGNLRGDPENQLPC